MDALLTPSDLPPSQAPARGVVRSVAAERASRGAVLVKPRFDEIDERTLSLAQQRDRAAIEAFVQFYQRRVFAFLSRAIGARPEVEDLAQEVFLRALRALPRFERRGVKVSTWLLTIAVRLVSDERRRKRPTLVALDEQLVAPGPDAERDLDGRRALEKTLRLAATLPADQRVAFVLFEFEGLGHREISEMTGAPVATVKTRLSRARRALREGLEEVEP